MQVQEKGEILQNYAKMWLKGLKATELVEYIDLYTYDFKG